MNAIEFENFGFQYGGEGSFCLSNVSLRVREGEFFALLGETGSGKSTLLLSLNGIVPHLLAGKCNGSVRVLGKDPQKEGVKGMSRLVSFVFQDPNEQIFCKSALEEACFGLSSMGVSQEEAQRRALDALCKVGMQWAAQHEPTSLSFGQKQKIALACALARDTPIIALDEPVSSMDFRTASEMYGILAKLNKDGKTIVVAEHDTDYLHGRAGAVAVLKEGRVALAGDAKLLFSKKAQELGVRKPCTCRK